MNKKKILIVGGICLIAIAAIVIGIILVTTSGTKDANTQNGQSDVLLSGTYLVTSRADAEVGGETLVFDGKDARDYRDNSSEPFFTDAYSIDAANNLLVLSNSKKSFKITPVTENVVRLYDIDTEETWQLLKVPDGKENQISKETLVGSWKVQIHGGNAATQEKMKFTETEFSFFVGGNTEPAKISTYSWTSNTSVTITDMGLNLHVIGFDSDRLFFVEVGSGSIWEIVRD